MDVGLKQGKTVIVVKVRKYATLCHSILNNKEIAIVIDVGMDSWTLLNLVGG